MFINELKILLDDFTVAENKGFKDHDVTMAIKLVRKYEKKLEKSGKSSLTNTLEKALKAPKKDVKIRVNTFIDLDVYDELKHQAESDGLPYQALLNKYLRASVLGDFPKTDKIIMDVALKSRKKLKAG